MNDVELLARARRGDQAAFTALFARHQRAIFRYASHMCGRGAEDDIVQETFLAVLREPARFDAARGSVAAYLLGIARHRALKRMPARPGDLAIEDAPAADIAIHPTVLDDMTREQAACALREAIAELPPVFREAIVLCDIEEMDYSDAAIIMECPIGTVRSRVHRGRALLSEKLAGVPACRAAR